ncbi:helix-turn-helix domain-containing protein [Blautia sp.]|uniref:helix-turn-helix domain-containing protein n=1 Tax=Blautia sp. TaxID=1955243 RepID=UPI00258CCA6A|nr:helix-turn-helix domain-containing protein [Blautia sp.]
MSETSYSVSETAKLLDVQSHVLRFWEEELHLPIDRNEMGHRYYTRYDIQVLLAIKELKKKGLALKEIGSLIPFLYKDEENRDETEQRTTGSREKVTETVQQKTPEPAGQRPAEQRREIPASRKSKRAAARKAAARKNRPVQNHNSAQEKNRAVTGKTRQAPVQAEAEAESQVPAEFMEILDRLVKERMRTLHSGEERYKRLDERIRICQKSRREVAAAMEQERQKNKKLFKKKR